MSLPWGWESTETLEVILALVILALGLVSIGIWLYSEIVVGISKGSRRKRP